MINGNNITTEFILPADSTADFLSCIIVSEREKFKEICSTIELLIPDEEKTFNESLRSSYLDILKNNKLSSMKEILKKFKKSTFRNYCEMLLGENCVEFEEESIQNLLYTGIIPFCKEFQIKDVIFTKLNTYKESRYYKHLFEWSDYMHFYMKKVLEYPLQDVIYIGGKYFICTLDFPQKGSFCGYISDHSYLLPTPDIDIQTFLKDFLPFESFLHYDKFSLSLHTLKYPLGEMIFSSDNEDNKPIFIPITLPSFCQKFSPDFVNSHIKEIKEISNSFQGKLVMNDTFIESDV